MLHSAETVGHLFNINASSCAAMALTVIIPRKWGQSGSVKFLHTLALYGEIWQYCRLETREFIREFYKLISFFSAQSYY